MDHYPVKRKRLMVSAEVDDPQVDSKVDIKEDVSTDVKKPQQLKASDYRQQNFDLMKTFGGKRQNRVVQQREKLSVSLQTNETSLLNAIQNMGVKVEAARHDVLAQESIAEILPPCDRNASTVDKVYDLSKLLGPNILHFMDIQRPVLNHDEMSSFTQQLLGTGGVDAQKGAAKVAAFIVIDDLIKFIKLPYGILRKQSLTFIKYNVIHSWIVHHFCEKNGNRLSRPLALRDKAIAYCMALSLVLANYTIPLGALSHVINTDVQKLKQVGRAIGGTCPPYSDQLILKLPLPPLPLLSKKRQR